MDIKPLGLDDPIFVHFIESLEQPRPAHVFYEDERMIIFPTNKEEQRSKAGAGAAMSYVHLLAIPKKRYA